MNPHSISHLFSQTMNTSTKPLIGSLAKARSFLQLTSLAVAIVCAATSVAYAAKSGSTGRKFATPEEAVAALRAAATAVDTNALRTIFGAAADDLQNPDRTQAINELKSFGSALAATNHLLRVSDSLVVVELGNDFWPFPVPLVKTDNGWYFDTDAGKEELLSRRIGRNELAVLPVMRAFVDAQRDYASLDHDGDEIYEYAQRMVSSPGKNDGLYWPPAFDGDLSPLGPLVAYAQAEGYSSELQEQDEPERGPFHGYYFKILTRQGKHARGGKYNYVINRNMIGGFSFIAWPAEYGDSGVMTFIVNQQGRVYQKDLGRATSKTARSMTQFDPDSSWKLSPE